MTNCGISLLDALTVVEVAVPIVGEKSAECPAGEAEEWLLEQTMGVDDPLGHFAVVVEGNNTVGWFGIESFPAKGASVEKVVRHGPNFQQTIYSRDYPLRDAQDPLETSQIVSSDTTLFELLELLTTPPPYVLFVLRGRKITHSLTFDDLVSTQTFGIGIFSLLLTLEAAILDAAKLHPEEAFECLSSRDRKRVMDTYSNMHRTWSAEEPPSGREQERMQWFISLLECTTYNHKVIIASRLEQHQLQTTIRVSK